MAYVHTSETSAESPPLAWYIQWLLSRPPAKAQPDSLLVPQHSGFPVSPTHAVMPLRYDIKGLSVSIPGCQGREDKAVRPLRA